MPHNETSDMSFDPSRIETLSAEYAEAEPLYAVEKQHLETLPDAFASGKYGRRDASWVVRWYGRRFLGSFPDEKRRRTEAAFGRNDFGAIREAIGGAVDAGGLRTALDSLRTLEAVDVAVASAFLFHIDPDEYLVVGEPEWNALSVAGELSEPYPDPPSVEAYERYLDGCRRIAGEADTDLRTLYRALWRAGKRE